MKTNKEFFDLFHEKLPEKYKKHLYMCKDDDGSLVEWIGEEFRIGVNVVGDETEAGWHIVSKHTMGNVICMGEFSNVEYDKIMDFFVSFISIFQP